MCMYTSCIIIFRLLYNLSNYFKWPCNVMLTGSAIISLTIFYWKWLALNFQLQFTVHTCILNWGSLECKVKWSPSPKTSSLLPYKDRKPGNLWQTVPRLCVLSLWKVLLSLPEFRQLFTLDTALTKPSVSSSVHHHSLLPSQYLW